jgi:hypothetical protein
MHTAISCLVTVHLPKTLGAVPTSPAAIGRSPGWPQIVSRQTMYTQQQIEEMARTETTVMLFRLIRHFQKRD